MNHSIAERFVTALEAEPQRDRHMLNTIVN